MRSQLFILLSLLTFAIEAAGQQYYFRQYTSTEGLHHSFVYDVNQDKDGYMWVGTPEGIYRFNGFDFELFTVDDGLAENFISRIYRDSDGRVWLGHQNGSLSLRLGNGFTLFKGQTEDQGSVTDITEDESGSIWCSTLNQGLSLIDKDLVMKSVTFTEGDESITQIEYIGDDQFIIGTQDRLFLTIYHSDQSSMEILQRFESYPGSRVFGIFQDAYEGYIVVSQDYGIYYLSPRTISGEFQFSVIDENSDGILDNLQGGLMDGNGDLWLYSMGNGLIQYKSAEDHVYVRVARISGKNGLVSENVRSMFEDVEGNLWIGMFGEGLLRYVDDNLKLYRYNEAEEPIECYTIAAHDFDILAVVGSRLLKINQFGDSVLNTYVLPETHLGDRVNTVFTSDDGRIWLGYEQSGLLVSDSYGKQFRPVFISKDELSNSINHITGKGEYIWVGTKKGLCRISISTGEIQWFTTNEGMPHNHIKQLYIDSQERVMIATLSNRLYYILHNNDVTFLENSVMGPLNSIISLDEDLDGNLWAGTHGNGVWLIKEDTLLNFNSTSGLLSDFCYSLSITKEGELIIGHSGGISRIDPDTKKIKTFSRHEGVKSSTEFFQNAVFSDRMGNVWFGTSEGIIKYSSSSSKGGMIPPMLLIRNVLIDGDTVDHSDGPILLKSGQYEIVVDFIGISFTNPEMVLYQTQLENYNESWSDPSFNRSVKFDRVGYGDYTFKIRAFNENDVLSELSPAFEIRIMKPVYLSVWFYLLIAFIIGFSFFMVLRIRERNHKMVQERLLKNLDEKTKEIIVKEEIIKERKKVEKILIEAKTKAELSDKLKSSFLRNMSHEIRTPMNAIVGFTQLLCEEGLSIESRNDFIANVSANAESLLKLIDDILDLSKLETNQLEIEIEELEVNDLIRDVEIILRKRLSVENNENVEFVTKCPGKDEFVIMADRTRLIQILNSLLDNALKFTESGSIILGYTVDDKNTTFFVEDTGIGLSEDKKDIVFDLFRKVEDDRFKLYGGTGLGLTLAKYLVELMGGELDVDSKENVGCKFYFNIPLISQ